MSSTFLTACAERSADAIEHSDGDEAKALQCYFGLMRHGPRLDALTDLNPSQLAQAGWYDREARPYDTPINDLVLPVERAREMRARRCCCHRWPITPVRFMF